MANTIEIMADYIRNAKQKSTNVHFQQTLDLYFNNNNLQEIKTNLRQFLDPKLPIFHNFIKLRCTLNIGTAIFSQDNKLNPSVL